MKKLGLLSLLAICLAGCRNIGNVDPTGTPHPPPTPAASHGRWIASSVYEGSQRDIVLLDPASGETINLTSAIGGGTQPAWSPDGRRIAFVSTRDGNQEIYVMDSDGGNLLRLTNNLAPDDSPDWSSDGTKISFLSSRDHIQTMERDLFVMEADGSNVRKLASELALASAVWSPIGNDILFQFYAQGETVIAQLSYRDPEQVTRLAPGSEPAWSPDGSRIAFIRETETLLTTPDPAYAGINRRYDSELYIMNASGSDSIRIATIPGYAGGISWDPDGRSILLHVSQLLENGTKFDLFQVNIEDGTLVALTDTLDTDESDPEWQPDPNQAVVLTSPTAASCQDSALFLRNMSPSSKVFLTAYEGTYRQIWEIENSGTCAWTSDRYQIVEVAGDAIPFPGAIDPGDKVDIVLELPVPDPGTTVFAYRVQGPDGYLTTPSGAVLELDVTMTVFPLTQSILPTPLYFLSDRSGSVQLWRLEVDGHTEMQITHEAKPVSYFDLSPDGTVAFTTDDQLLLADPYGGMRRALVDGLPVSHPVFSPDGDHIAYTLQDSVNVFDLTTGSGWTLLTGSGTGIHSEYYDALAWSPDGRHVLIRINYWEAHGLMLIPATGGDPIPLPEDCGVSYAWQAASDDFFIGFPSHGMCEQTAGIYRLDPNSINLEELVTIPAEGWYVVDGLNAPDNGGVYFFTEDFEDQDQNEVRLGLYVIQPDEPPVQALVWIGDHLRFDREILQAAVWSPDGWSALLGIGIQQYPGKVWILNARDLSVIGLGVSGRDFQWAPIPGGE